MSSIDPSWTRPAREMYIRAAVGGALSVHQAVGPNCEDPTRTQAAWEFLWLAFAMADRYTSTEERHRQREFIMKMAFDAGAEITGFVGGDPDEMGSAMTLIDVFWGGYRSSRTPWRDGSEPVRLYLKTLTANSALIDVEGLKSAVELALLALPLGELMEECGRLGPSPVMLWHDERAWAASPEAFVNRLTPIRLAKLASHRNSDGNLKDFVLHHGPLPRKKVRMLSASDRRTYFALMVSELRERLAIWIWRDRGETPQPEATSELAG